jgi:hypothetical protein
MKEGFSITVCTEEINGSQEQTIPPLVARPSPSDPFPVVVCPWSTRKEPHGANGDEVPDIRTVVQRQLSGPHCDYHKTDLPAGTTWTRTGAMGAPEQRGMDQETRDRLQIVIGCKSGQKTPDRCRAKPGQGLAMWTRSFFGGFTVLTFWVLGDPSLWVG